MLENGARIVFTGRGADRHGAFISRDELTRHAQRAGWIVVDQMDYTVTVLIASRQGTSKARYARQNNIPILTYLDFWNALDEHLYGRPQRRPSVESKDDFVVREAGSEPTGGLTLWEVFKTTAPQRGEVMRTWVKDNAEQAAYVLNTWANGLIGFPLPLLGYEIRESETGFVADDINSPEDREMRTTDFEVLVRRIVTQRDNEFQHEREIKANARRQAALQWTVKVVTVGGAQSDYPFYIATPDGQPVTINSFTRAATLPEAINIIRMETGEQHPTVCERLGLHNDGVYGLLTLRINPEEPLYVYEVVPSATDARPIYRVSERGFARRRDAFEDACRKLGELLSVPSSRVQERFAHLTPRETHTLNAKRRIEL